jgi:hypothetical protein
MNILEKFCNAATQFNRENGIVPVFGQKGVAKICELGKTEMEYFNRMAPVSLEEADYSIRELSFVEYFEEKFNIKFAESESESCINFRFAE